ASAARAPEAAPRDPAVGPTRPTALARGAGARGLAGGQRPGLRAEQRAGEGMWLAANPRLQRLKTGALISFSCTAGAILGKAADSLRNALSAYAHDLGLAFQIVDDLLDVEGDAAEIGKTPGKDAAAGKATFVSILGRDGAGPKAGRWPKQAPAPVEQCGEKPDFLRQAANFVVSRRA